MNKQLLTAAVAVLCGVGSVFGQAAPGNWTIAAGYSVRFSTTGEVGGIIKGLTGNIQFDEGNLTRATFNVAVDAATLNTGNGVMNTHAKSAEYLDAGKFPRITFVATKVTKTGSGYQAEGNLTLHGVTKPVTLPFTFQRTASGGLFHGTFTVNRNDYKVGKPGDVEDEISIELSVPVTKK